MTVKEKIESGRTYLGIELGSTRIKASLVDDTFTPIASGSHSWENRFENGYWTYSLEDIHTGVQACFGDLAKDVRAKYGLTLRRVGAMGISAMMHGYMAFDRNDRLLTPFRTWRNTTTEKAASQLTELFGFNIPQRWSISHLWQAIIDKESHVGEIAYITTLAGYIHFLLTGRHEVGIGEASGIFPVENGGYNHKFAEIMNAEFAKVGFEHKLEDILPTVKTAGERGAFLTRTGAEFLDPTGNLESGIPLCPPEGDAGTGMTATNSVLPRTGNVSAGTSVFSMLVLDKPMNGYYPEIDMVTTPDGSPVAMVHCNNCCGEIDGWVNMFAEFSRISGGSCDISKVYEILYTNALSADPDTGGLFCCNYLSGEPVTGFESGRPMYFRKPDEPFTLGGFFRGQLYSAFAALKIGMDILFEKETAVCDKITAHGGLFKVKGAAQQILADGLESPVTVMETAGEGGAWGMALLAAYMNLSDSLSLSEFLDTKVFGSMESSTLMPDEKGVKGFKKFIENYKASLSAERTAVNLREE